MNFDPDANKNDGTCKYDKVITDYNISVKDLMSLNKRYDQNCEGFW